MKPSVGLLLTCSIALVARSVCQASPGTVPFPAAKDEKIRSIIDQLVATVDNLQQKSVELRRQLQEHRQEMTQIREDHDKTLAGILMTMNRLDERLGNDFGSFSVKFGLMQNRTLEVLAQQSECASHELFRERVLPYLQKANLPNLLQPGPVLPAMPDKKKPTSQQVSAKHNITCSTRLSENSEDLTTISSEGDVNQQSFKNCMDEPSKVSGPYSIRAISGSKPFTAYCEQQAFGGGWHVVQYRFDGSLDFQRSWAEYRDGFGDINREFWIGLEKLHQLTSSRPCELVIEIKDFRDNYAYARYDAFEIGDEGEQYRLKTLGQYNGTAGDSMAYHRGMKFSTLDRDNDEIDENCAQKYGGAWWHKGCYDAHLNGRYMNARNASAMGWYRFKSSNQGLSYSRMMVRSVK